MLHLNHIAKSEQCCIFFVDQLTKNTNFLSKQVLEHSLKLTNVSLSKSLSKPTLTFNVSKN